MKIWQIVGIILCFFLPFCTNVKRVLQTTEGLKKKSPRASIVEAGNRICGRGGN